MHITLRKSKTKLGIVVSADNAFEKIVLNEENKVIGQTTHNHENSIVYLFRKKNANEPIREADIAIIILSNQPLSNIFLN